MGDYHWYNHGDDRNVTQAVVMYVKAADKAEPQV